MKWTIHSYCSRCGKINHATIYEGLQLEDMNCICQCSEEAT
jgi:hypothetical protein